MSDFKPVESGPSQRNLGLWIGLGLLMAGGIVAAFVFSSSAQDTPGALERLTRRMTQSGRFTRLDISWQTDWKLSAMEDAPWTDKLADALPAAQVDPSQGVTVINLWATWCPPCREEMPSLLAFAQEHRDQGVQFVFISYDDGWDEVREMYQKVGGGLPAGVVNIRDSREAGADGKPAADTFWTRLGATALPETFFVVNGKVVGKVIGGIDWSHADIRDYLRLIAR